MVAPDAGRGEIEVDAFDRPLARDGFENTTGIT
jgi:hypothetical protein